MNYKWYENTEDYVLPISLVLWMLVDIETLPFCSNWSKVILKASHLLMRTNKFQWLLMLLLIEEDFTGTISSLGDCIIIDCDDKE